MQYHRCLYQVQSFEEKQKSVDLASASVNRIMLDAQWQEFHAPS